MTKEDQELLKKFIYLFIISILNKNNSFKSQLVIYINQNILDNKH